MDADVTSRHKKATNNDTSPAPTRYSVKASGTSSLKEGPSFSMARRYKDRSNIPGGADALYLPQRTGPEYSITGKWNEVQRQDDRPGPAQYFPQDDAFANKPAYSIGGRLREPANNNEVPGVSL